MMKCGYTAKNHMRRSSKEHYCRILNSPIPSIPLFGYVFLLIQIMLIQVCGSKTFYMSTKKKALLGFFLTYINRKFDGYFFESFHFSLIMRENFPKPFILNVTDQRQYVLSDVLAYNDILWSLTWCLSVSKITSELLEKKFGGDYRSLFLKKPSSVLRKRAFL